MWRSNFVKDRPFLKQQAQNSSGLEHTESRLALIWNWVEAVSWQACLITPLKWDYQTHSDGHSSGSTVRRLPPHFQRTNNRFVNFLEVLNSFFSPSKWFSHAHARAHTHVRWLPITNLPAGLLSPLQHTSVFARGTGGCSISAASGSASSSSRPTHSPTTRGRRTEL